MRREIHAWSVIVAMALNLLPVAARTRDESAFRLRAEWTGPCLRRPRVDVNLGNRPEAFIRAATCQVTGREAKPTSVTQWAAALHGAEGPRREDVVRAICATAHRDCRLDWSDPWIYGAVVEPKICIKRYRRDIGAVMMFFFHCPDARVNCALDWSDNHVRGMNRADASLGWGAARDGYYNPRNPGFWRHELRDAQAAGLQFLLPNVYGPDMAQIDGLVAALNGKRADLKVGLFDDSWAWGHASFGSPWATAPDLSQTESAAQTLYRAKWKPYFAKVPPQDWYRIDNRPVIYLYNAGTLRPLETSAAVVARMKALFATDFGVAPFVVVDDAFFRDPGMATVADSRFRWDTFAGDFAAADGSVTVKDGVSRSVMSGRVTANAMVRWDSIDRDRMGAGPGFVSPFAGRTLKGPQRLETVLETTHGDDSLVIATWNDLGEGTGVNAAYDYYDHGAWRRPDSFMQMIRNDNCSQ